MNAITITSKGQIILHKDVLEHLGVHPGDEIAVDKLPDGRIEIRRLQRKGKISDIFGLLKREGQRPISIEEMNEIIEKGWAGDL